MPDNAATVRVPFLTIPNALSVMRLVVVLPEMYFAAVGNKVAFLALVAFALFTDSIDGTIARRLRQDSILGAKLDSLGDLATYVSIPVCGWLLWPEIIRAELVFVIVGILSYLLPVIVGLIRYRRLTSYHTWGAKISAVLMGAAVLMLFMGISPWPFRVFTPIAALAGIEEIAITFILREWHANVPTLWHARRIGAADALAPRSP
jgi:CDP-diacylglycerol--glycerol-3-phosphate 3-phosphatidyltransferase